MFTVTKKFLSHPVSKKVFSTGRLHRKVEIKLLFCFVLFVFLLNLVPRSNYSLLGLFLNV